MDEGTQDTIAAVATAPGRGAIAVVRASGPAVPSMVRALGLPPLEPRRATTAVLRHPDNGGPLDRVVATRFEAPASYTGEHLLEVGCHGGALVPQLVLDALCAAGARPALAGEFTRRAYLNGKLDLIQAEATLDLVDARSEALHRAALVQLRGGLSRRVEALRERLLELHALLAYDIDFPEEDEGPIPAKRLERAAASVDAELASLLRHAPQGERLREGALTVIAGRPNVGKSSLFNTLLDEERAIVTAEPGTTRDAIEALLTVEGYPFRLVDTAGIRHSAGPIEALGIEVAERYLREADLVLFCAEAGRPLEPAERDFLARLESEGRKTLRLRTKADRLPGAAEGRGPATAAADAERREEEPRSIPVSAESGVGMSALRAALLDAAYRGLRDEAEAPLVTRRRQARALRAAREEMRAFAAAREAGRPAEIAAVHLSDATARLEELLGSVDTEEVLGALFARFCVGK